MKDEMRPCIVNGQNALFHCWGQAGVEKRLKSGEYGVVNKIYGVVEFEDGSCAQVVPELIVFSDKDDQVSVSCEDEETDGITGATVQYIRR